LQKKKLHIKSGFLLAAGLYSIHVQAQITVNLPSANITARTDYQQNFTSGTYTSALGLLPTIGVKSNNANFSNTVGGNGPAPLNLAHIKLVSINNLTVLGTITEIALSTTNQNIYAAVASVSSGTVLNNLRLTTAGFIWVAGTYTTELFFLAPGLLGLGNVISPATHTMNIIVPAFITPLTSAGTTSILVNNLSFYRTPAGINVNKPISLANTVIYRPSLQTGNSNFSFSSTLPYNTLPNTPVASVATTLTAVPTATPITLSTTAQGLTTVAGLAVPTNNSQTMNYAFSIDAAKLKTGFLQAGTYSVPLTYSWNKPTATYPTGALQTQAVGSLEVVVSDLSEIIANQSTVNLVFSTASHYQNGINQDMSAHIKLSKTTPYNVYVRASSANFGSGVNSIPLDVMRIGPMPGQTGMQTITLSATAQQLINGADPVIDRSLNIRYSIPASEISKLLNKPAGTYTTNIIFSFVAP
jgi:hypothetical protein